MNNREKQKDDSPEVINFNDRTCVFVERDGVFIGFAVKDDEKLKSEVGEEGNDK